MRKVSLILLVSFISCAIISCGDDDSATLDKNASNILLVETFYELSDAGNSAEYSKLFADTFVDHNRSANSPEFLSDKESILGTLGQLNTGFPDGAHRIDIIEDIGKDRVMVYWIFSGTNTGDFFGAPASNRSVQIAGIDIFQISEGQFTEQWHVEDLFGLFAQISEE